MSKQVNRKKEALRRLKVKPEELATVPDISTLLKQANGGLIRTLEAMRFSNDLNVVSFLEKYDSIPACDRRYLSWEAIALAAEVDHTYLLGGAILALQSYSANAVKIIALTSHPEVMKKRVEYAQLPGGHRDRDAIQTGLGFLPTAKGSTFIINPGTKPEAKDDLEDPEDERESDLDHLFPSLSKTQDALVPVRSRMLEAGQ